MSEGVECRNCGHRFSSKTVESYTVFDGGEYPDCPECGEPWRLWEMMPRWARALAPLFAAILIVVFSPILIWNRLKRLWRWLSP